MNRFTLRDNAIEEDQPWGILPDELDETTGNQSFSYIPLREKWLRVFPGTGKDVSFLRMLTHHVEKFAPAHGTGVLVKASVLI